MKFPESISYSSFHSPLRAAAEKILSGRHFFSLDQSWPTDKNQYSVPQDKSKKKKYQSCLATAQLKDEEHMIYLFILTTEQTRSIIQFPSKAKVISSQQLIFWK